MVLEAFSFWAEELIVEFSYLAVFFLSIISTSTVFVPLPIYLVIFFASGLGLNPLVVGIISGLGMAVGELVGYLVGIGSRAVVEKNRKIPPIVVKLTKLFKKFGFWVILVAAFLPFPFDFIGILAGVSNYDLKKFYFATTIGKIAKALFIAYAGFLIIPYVGIYLAALF